MYKLNDSILMSRVDILDTFVEGKECFLNDQVREVRANSNYSYFQGQIIDDITYNSKVRFKDDGYIKFTSCDCSDYKRSLGDCKHIVALFYFIREFEKKQDLNQKRELELQNMISEYSSEKEVDRTYLNVEYNLEVAYSGKDNILKGANISIRIGENRFYLVRDFDTFFQHRHKKELIFGKFFTYNPKVHRFKHRDLYIINFLHRIYENANIYMGEENKRSLEGKYIFLSPRLLKEFLDLMDENKLNILIHDEDFNDVPIINDSLPLSMDINDENDNLIVKLSSDKDIDLLTLDGKYMFIEGSIYKLSDNEREKIFPIYDQIILKAGGEVTIPREYREGYISSVLRNVRGYIDLHFSDKVLSLMYEPNLESEIYFDDANGAITGKVVFNYEGIKINPFSSKDSSKIKNNKILIRDSEKENNILSILEEGYFKVEDGGIYLDDNDDIYNLVTDIVPKLQNFSNIFYSESFKSAKVNVKDIDAVLKIHDNLNMLEFTFDINGKKINEIDKIYKAIKEGKKYYRLQDGSFLPLNEEYFGVLKEANDYNLDIENDKLLLPKYMVLLLEDYFKGDLSDIITLDDKLEKLITDIQASKNIDYKIPEKLSGVLRGYQKKGFNWLKTLAKYGLGGILADDMGLGKTLQVITFLLSEKEEYGKNTSLVVVPSSLIYNWKSEIEKFTDNKLKTILIQGSKEERMEQISEIKDHDIAITSYHLLRNDIDLYKDINFRFCIIDEAQNIKNSESLNAKSCKQVQADSKFALTGTPMENALSELWSIFDFLMPGYLLSKKDFINKYEKPIFQDDSKSQLKELNNKTKPFIMRRLKKDVLTELPDKIEQKILVHMTEEQKKVYAEYINTLKREIEEEISKKGFSRAHIKILTALMRLRQLCCDPSLFIPDYTGGSGKLDSLREIVQEALAADHRILIFSQFTSMLDIIKKQLDEDNISNILLTGSTPVKTRDGIVNDFNSGTGDIMLISLKAGGSGLNLVGADMVIHFDPWWNPAVQEQATDRVYRIGQENTVQVMKLIAKGTIEEKIFDLQEHKKEMIDMVIKEGETIISKLNEEEILSLFTV